MPSSSVQFEFYSVMPLMILHETASSDSSQVDSPKLYTHMILRLMLRKCSKLAKFNGMQAFLSLEFSESSRHRVEWASFW